MRRGRHVLTTPPADAARVLVIALQRAFTARPRPKLCLNRNGRAACRHKAIARPARITACACIIIIRACWPP